ncbi:MAG: magnesium and cobalt transport protein CorA, partial [Brevibacterium linens]
MPSDSRHHFERPSLRKRASAINTGQDKLTAALFSRRIVNSEPQELVTSSSFNEALAAHISEGLGVSQGSTTQVIVPRSTPELLAEIASTWDLHPVLVDDIYHANQRAKVERYDDVLFVVLKSAVYIDAKEEVDF